MRSARPRSVGISIEGCTDVQVSGANLRGLGIGIHVKNSPGTLINDAQFQNVDLPICAEGSGGVSISSSKAIGARISQSLKAAPALPSYCPRCDNTFPSRFARFKGPVVQFWGNKESCPNCGYEEAFVAEGVFQLIAELIQILWAAPETKKWLSVPFSSRNDTASTGSTLNGVSSSSLPTVALSWIGEFIKRRPLGVSFSTSVAIATLVWTVLNDREASKQFDRLIELEQQQIDSYSTWESEIATDALLIQVLHELDSLNSNSEQTTGPIQSPEKDEQ